MTRDGGEGAQRDVGPVESAGWIVSGYDIGPECGATPAAAANRLCPKGLAPTLSSATCEVDVSCRETVQLSVPVHPFTFALPPLQQSSLNPFMSLTHTQTHTPSSSAGPCPANGIRQNANQRSAMNTFSPPSASQALAVPPSKRPLSLDMGLMIRDAGPSSSTPSSAVHPTPSSLANAMHLPPTVADVVPRLQQTLSRISPPNAGRVGAEEGEYTIPPPMSSYRQQQQVPSRHRSQDSPPGSSGRRSFENGVYYDPLTSSLRRIDQIIV